MFGLVWGLTVSVVLFVVVVVLFCFVCDSLLVLSNVLFFLNSNFIYKFVKLQKLGIYYNFVYL